MSAEDRLARRLLSLRESLAALEARPEAADASSLAADPVLKAAVERWLQVAVEACIDVAQHVVSREGWTPPTTARATFLSLATHGVIALDLAQRLGSAAALRNLLVHDYADVDVIRLAAIVRDDLGDLRRLAAAAAPWVDRDTTS